MKHRTITDGLLFPEGPIAMPDGTVLVVEIARGTLTRVFPDGRKEIVAETGGGPTGRPSARTASATSATTVDSSGRWSRTATAARCAGDRWFANCPGNHYHIRNYQSDRADLVYRSSEDHLHSAEAGTGAGPCNHPNVVDIEVFIGPEAWGAHMGRQSSCKTPGQVGWPGSGSKSFWNTIKSWL